MLQTKHLAHNKKQPGTLQGKMKTKKQTNPERNNHRNRPTGATDKGIIGKSLLLTVYYGQRDK